MAKKSGMANKSRRNFIKRSVTLAATAAAVPALAEAAMRNATPEAESTLPARTDAVSVGQSYEIRSSANPPWVPVKILDTERMPWPPAEGPLGWSRKMLFENKQTGDHLVIISVPIGAPGGRNHYHSFHEWAYWLTGDFTNNEYTSPDQRLGVMMQFKEGHFLDRPPYSLHGGEKDRLDSQVGGTCLIMEEGGKSVGVIPGDRGYSDEYKQVKQWAVPRIIDTLSSIPWEPEGSVPGLLVKRLVDDQTRGFRAILWRLAAGWNSSQSPQFARAYSYKQASQFNFVLAGDLNIQTYKAPGDKAEKVTLGKYFYVERAPMSIFGLADGVVSERGCVWLEVTYGKGTSISNIPIEEPDYV